MKIIYDKKTLNNTFENKVVIFTWHWKLSFRILHNQSAICLLTSVDLFLLLFWFIIVSSKGTCPTSKIHL